MKKRSGRSRRMEGGVLVVSIPGRLPAARRPEADCCSAGGGRLAAAGEPVR